MNMDFDTLWDTKNEARCPLTNQQLESMIARAREQSGTQWSATDASMVKQVSLTAGQSASKRWVLPFAAAACLILMVFPLARKNVYGAVPHTIDYQGQQVKFICNNQCDASSVIESLDAFIQ